MEGMVITVEPGIYVPQSATFPKHFHNLGIRIEVGRHSLALTQSLINGRHDDH
jgi:hypothetical protein